MNCSQRYHPDWSSRGIRAVQCERPAKRLALRPTYSTEQRRTVGEWMPVCGIHARLYTEFREIDPKSLSTENASE